MYCINNVCHMSPTKFSIFLFLIVLQIYSYQAKQLSSLNIHKNFPSSVNKYTLVKLLMHTHN